jgi:hypothetical protein
MARIQFNRGAAAGTPTLAEGEPGWLIDSRQLIVGSDMGNVLIGPPSGPEGAIAFIGPGGSLFADGLLLWDGLNGRLGIGAAPEYDLSLEGDRPGDIVAHIWNHGAGGGGMVVGTDDETAAALMVHSATGAVAAAWYGSGSVQVCVNGGVFTVGVPGRYNFLRMYGPGAGGTLRYDQYAERAASGAMAPHWELEGGALVRLYQMGAEPDTSGATLAELETQVNRLKQVLRSLGVISSV